MPNPGKKRKTASQVSRRKGVARPHKPRAIRPKAPVSAPPAAPALPAPATSLPSPWATAWLHPRQTVANVLARNPRQGIIPLSFVKGSAQIFGSVSLYHLGNHMEAWAILLMTAVLAFPAGYVGIYVQGWIYEVVGYLLGGQGKGEQTRVAAAWCCVPEILSVPANVGMLLLFGSTVFMHPLPQTDNPLVLGLSMVVFGLFLLSLAVWVLILALGALAEVHRFTLWRAFWTLLIPSAVWGIFMVLFNRMGAM